LEREEKSKRDGIWRERERERETNPPLSTPTKRSAEAHSSAISSLVGESPKATAVANAEAHTNAELLDSPAPYHERERERES
jgi:hypothetical protein